MANHSVRLLGITKSYGQRVVTPVLHGIDLAIEAGEFTAIIGPSGSGKSTLLNLIGLLDRPTSGSLCINGQETTHLSDADLTRLRGRTLGFIFQFHHLLPEFTALENVMMPVLASGRAPTAAITERALSLLERVGLAQKAKVRATLLSGGQQQRVAVARALMYDPPIILADEPTGNLDTQSADAVFALLRDFNRERGTTTLVITHDPRLSTRCDRQIQLVDGRICRDQPAAVAD